MRQRTLGIIGAALLVAGVAVDVGTDIAVRRLPPAATLTPAGGQLQMPRRQHDGMRPGVPPGYHPRGSPTP